MFMSKYDVDDLGKLDNVDIDNLIKDIDEGAINFQGCIKSVLNLKTSTFFNFF